MRTKLALTAFTATAALLIAVTAASARRFELSNQRFQAIWSLIRWEFQNVFTVECPLTLEGSFHSRTLSKVSGQLIGYVTSAKIRGGLTECNNTGTSRVLTATLPWHIRYDRFIGALPTITGIRIQVIDMSIALDAAGAAPNCLMRTEAAHPGAFIAEPAAGGLTRTLRADETQTIPVGGVFECEIIATQADFRGTAELFVQGSTTTRITVRLVQ